MLFVIDGAKALRKAIRTVFGDRAPVQRCVRHKERNGATTYPADPSRVEEIIAVMRQAGDGMQGDRVRGDRRPVARRPSHPRGARLERRTSTSGAAPCLCAKEGR